MDSQVKGSVEGALAVMATVFALTGIPGINTFCKPSTMTLSPGFSPCRTMRKPSARRPGVMSRRCAFLFIDDINVFTILIGQHRFVVDKRGFELRAARQAYAGKKSRRELTLRVIQQRAHADGAGTRRQLIIRKSTLP
jgi:hypothetical protein